MASRSGRWFQGSFWVRSAFRDAERCESVSFVANDRFGWVICG